MVTRQISSHTMRSQWVCVSDGALVVCNGTDIARMSVRVHPISGKLVESNVFAHRVLLTLLINIVTN